ncbi:MAG: hypothetical protein OHK0048_13700 [Rhodoferax sp.]
MPARHPLTMQYLRKFLKWLLKAAIFFTLFAFALNNQHEVTVHFFFGHSWRAPLALVVLIVLALGMAVGVVGMLPWWWRQRNSAHPAAKHASGNTAVAPPPPTRPTATGLPPNSGYADGI